MRKGSKTDEVKFPETVIVPNLSNIVDENIQKFRTSGLESVRLDIGNEEKSCFFTFDLKIPPRKDKDPFSLYCDFSGKTQQGSVYGIFQNLLESFSDIGKINSSKVEVVLENGQALLIDHMCKPSFNQRSFKTSFFSREDVENSTALTGVLAEIVQRLYYLDVSSDQYDPKTSNPFLVGDKHIGESSRVRSENMPANQEVPYCQRVVTADIDQEHRVLWVGAFSDVLINPSDRIKSISFEMRGKYKLEVRVNNSPGESCFFKVSHYQTKDAVALFINIRSIWQAYHALTGTPVAEAELALIKSLQRPTLSEVKQSGIGDFNVTPVFLKSLYRPQ